MTFITANLDRKVFDAGVIEGRRIDLLGPSINRCEGLTMSMMLIDRDPKFDPRDAVESDLERAVLDDEVFAGDLYYERDSVLESELLESSLDDYDDLLSAVRDEFCEE